MRKSQSEIMDMGKGRRNKFQYYSGGDINKPFLHMVEGGTVKIPFLISSLKIKVDENPVN
jgi:hypothetical protein